MNVIIFMLLIINNFHKKIIFLKFENEKNIQYQIVVIFA